MDKCVDVVNLISTLLDSGKYKEALCIPSEEKYLNEFKDNCWDLISVIIDKIKDDTIITKPSLQGACEELLLKIVQKSVPEEALLEFIEQIELAKNDAQFSIILTPLQELLKRLRIKRGRSLEWCLNSISTYIEAIPTPDYQLEGKECLLLDSDTNYRRIIRVYSLLPQFYTPFVKELSVEGANNRTKQIISAFLISLLGKPLIFIDLDPESNSKSEIRQCISQVILDIYDLVKNIFKFLPYVELCFRDNKQSKNVSTDSEEEISPYEHREKINMTTLSGLFYVTLSGHFAVSDTAIPCVYSSEHVVNTILLCVVHLLNFTEYGPLCKGITLCKVLLSYIPDKSSSALLTLTTHYEVCKSLVNVAIYSNYEIIRKSAVVQINCHLNKFEYKGRCMLVKYILNIANHSGMIGYAITLYKNSINEAFNEPKMPDCFTGTQLMDIVKKICHLPHGAESDLVELADQIITALNFLRFLILRDKQNVTGIKGNEFIGMIETDYLEKLRIGLNMSKAHYEVKLKDIEEAKDVPSKEIAVTINVGGNVLDKIPTKNKKEIIHSALNAFHLIQGLVARLSECINMCKKMNI